MLGVRIAPRPHLQRQPWSDGFTVRVLIVDDVALFRDVASELVQHRGYTVAGEAASAAAAVETAARVMPDAALLDLGLPDGNGIEVSAALTRAHPGLAVLLTSADRDAPSDEQIHACGAQGFVCKSRLAATDLSQYWPSPARAHE
ncbi:response regulator [Solirubrobacter ginsenosidimutans]|uniref:Response regulator n=1 Tax=Solirubrobacter ginsenosidimutans TaxID=490573 RepID=A0A9X3MS29_9ACTN|nr:response regulator [Solirubrobacter ginsenosidimutans]MDA0161352.1 response regulator [Solirubrobacter ginsenosidimutans]